MSTDFFFLVFLFLRGRGGDPTAAATTNLACPFLPSSNDEKDLFRGRGERAQRRMRRRRRRRRDVFSHKNPTETKAEEGRGGGGRRKIMSLGDPYPPEKGGGGREGVGGARRCPLARARSIGPPLHLYYYYSDRGRGKSYPRAHRFSKTILNGGKKNRRAFPTPI